MLQIDKVKLEKICKELEEYRLSKNQNIDKAKIIELFNENFRINNFKQRPIEFLGSHKEGYLSFFKDRASARDLASDSAWESAWDSARASAWDLARASASDSAWESARDSAWDSASDSAWESAWDSASDLASDSASDSARDSAWASARDLASDSARDSASDSARASAWDLARASARDSAWESARDSARESTWESAWDSARDLAWGSARDLAKFFKGYLELYKNGLFSFWVRTNKIVCVCNPRIERNSLNQAHADLKEAILWENGEKYYFLNGVQIPKEIVLTPAKELESKSILGIENASIRREVIRKIGYSKILKDLKAKLLDSWREYELYRIEDADVEPISLIKCACPSTGTYYALRVPPDKTKCLDAVKWINHGVSPEEFLIET